MPQCCVPECLNSFKKTKGIPLFSFPSENRLRKLWLEAIKIDPHDITENHRVCLRHFEEEDIFRFASTSKLKANRIPHLHLIANEVEVEELSPSFEDINDSSTATPPRNVQRKPGSKKLRYIYRPTAVRPPFAIENYWQNDTAICRYTGVQTHKIFLILFNFVLKSEEGPFGTVHQTQYSKSFSIRRHKLSPLNELFLTLIKLRKAPDFHMLGDMFWVSESAACRIFNAWINLLYTKLGNLNIFPKKSVLLANAPKSFLKKYPNVLGSIDCTEFMIETPGSLVRQSQCFSHYKGTNTLKALIMIDANGAIIFVSTLYTGSISDKQIVQESGFIELLRKKVHLDELDRGDIILADKGFNIHNLLEDIGLELNIPTFRISGIQFNPNEIEYIRKIAHERVHVERAIRRLKLYRMLTKKIQISSMGCINQIFTVCALLTNYRFPLRK